jgi:hypothetical protein
MGTGISKVFAHAVACSALLASCAHMEEPLPTTVCAIVENPDRFKGQILKVSAVWHVGYHSTLLMDEACPKVGLTIEIPEDARSRDSILTFMDLAYGRSHGDFYRSGGPDVFTGRFQIEKRVEDFPLLVLELSSFQRRKH